MKLIDHSSNPSSPIMQCFGHKNSSLDLHCSDVLQIFPNYGLVYLRSVKLRTLRANKFKNQTNDIFKLLGHNCNHQQDWMSLNKKLLLTIVAVLT